MGLFSQVVVVSACVALALAQDYEYNINEDKVSFRQHPVNSQRQQSYNSFQSAQPSRTAPFAKYEAIPQVQGPQFAPQPQRFAAQSVPTRIQSRPRPSAASTYVPQSAPNTFTQNSTPNSFRPAAASTYVPNSAPTTFAQNAPPSSFTQNRIAVPAQDDGQYYPEEYESAPVSNPASVPQPQQFAPQPETAFEQAPVRRVKVRPAPSRSFQNEQPSVPTLPSLPSPSSSSTKASRKPQSAEDLALIQEQNANAKYSFSNQLDNSIQDNSLQRQEVRDGLAVRGMYSYSDGFYNRVVEYEADENGYRVVKETSEPIGNGPQLNLNGKADISVNNHDGSSLGYSITADDVVDLRKQRLPQAAPAFRPVTKV